MPNGGEKALLPESLLTHDLRGADRIVPRWLTDGDVGWISKLLTDREAFVGKRQRDLDAFLDVALQTLPARKARLVLRALAPMVRSDLDALLDSKETRAAVFTEAARGGSRADVVARVAGARKVEPARVEEALFADLPRERAVAPVPHGVTPAVLVQAANRMLLSGYLERATVVHVEAVGEITRLVRTARVRGLIVGVVGVGEGMAKLELSGPFTLFRKTRLYGHALANLVPHLGTLERFRMSARIALATGPRVLDLDAAAPVFPWPAPTDTASRLVRRFARAGEARTPAWTIDRDPPPLVSESLVVVPDFAAVAADGRRWVVELLGFWTAGHVSDRLARLDAAGFRDVVLCVDLDRNCGEGALGGDPRVLAYRRSLVPSAVFAFLEAAGTAPGAGAGGHIE